MRAAHVQAITRALSSIQGHPSHVPEVVIQYAAWTRPYAVQAVTMMAAARRRITRRPIDGTVVMLRGMTDEGTATAGRGADERGSRRHVLGGINQRLLPVKTRVGQTVPLALREVRVRVSAGGGIGR